jgi:hypothetical protein
VRLDSIIKAASHSFGPRAHPHQQINISKGHYCKRPLMSGEEVIKNQFSTRLTRAGDIGCRWLNFKYFISLHYRLAADAAAAVCSV